MFAKYALAALLVAAVPLAGATAAHARDSYKAEHSWKKSDHGSKYDHYKSNDSRKSHGSKYSKYGHSSKYNKFHRYNSCSAVAKKRYGYGKRLWGIGGKAYGRNACDRAMYECRRELGKRKSYGRNPFARCVISHRT